MAYIITVVSYKHGHAMPSGTVKRAVLSLAKTNEIASALFNWRPGDKLSKRESRIMEVIAGRGFNPIYDGSWVSVDKCDAAQAVNWMVENGFDPVTEDFITSFNSHHS